MGFLNIDLDVRSGGDLAPLISSLASLGVNLLNPVHTDADGLSLAIFETVVSGATCESTAAALFTALESLDAPGQAAWSAASSRALHLGYDASPSAVSDEISAALMKRAAALQLSLRFTLYPAPA